MRLYLDASAVIYVLEGEATPRQSVRDALVRVEATQGGAVISSALLRVECRVKALRDADRVLLAAYEGFLFHGSLELLPVSDAIHLATALDARADSFLTGDRKLARCPGLTVEVIEDT